MSILKEIIEVKDAITFKSTIKYLTFIIIYLLICTSNLYSGYLIDNPYRQNGIGRCYKNPITDKYQGLKDILHFDNPIIEKISTNLANFGFLLNIIVLFLAFLPYNLRNMKIHFLFLTLVALGYIIRVISFSVTVPPPPKKQEESNKIEWYKIHKIIFAETTPNAPLSDFMFSGHAFFIVLTLLFLWKYEDFSWLHHLLPKGFRFLLIILSIFSIFTIPSVTMSGLHYTSDVIIGVTMAILLFWSRYHFILHFNLESLV